jgi:hypothetical protein
MKWFHTYSPFECLVEKWNGTRWFRQNRIYPIDSECIHTFKLVESLRSFMLKTRVLTHHLSSLTTFSAKRTPCMLTYSILRISSFHSPTKHRNGTNPLYFSVQTKHEDGINPFLWNETMTLHSTWLPNQIHPWCFVRSIVITNKCFCYFNQRYKDR